MPDLLADGCGFTYAVKFAVKQGLVDSSMLKEVFTVLMQAPTILVILLTEDDAYNGDEESCCSVEHPYNHVILSIKCAFL